MKYPLFIILLSTFLGSVTHAEIPKKVPLDQYRELWLNSPFTSKPIAKTDGPIINPLDDYTLHGIAPVPGGYRITIANKKDKSKIVIEPGGNSDFKVVHVERNPDISLGTAVTLSKGSLSGIVRFEPKLIVLNTAPQANPAAASPPGVVLPQQENQPNQPQASPSTPTRSRIVPPGKPTQTQPSSPQTLRSRRTR